MEYFPTSTPDFKLFYVFVYEELDLDKVKADNIVNIMKHQAPFDDKYKSIVKKYHVIEVNTKQVLASHNAHIVSTRKLKGGLFSSFRYHFWANLCMNKQMNKQTNKQKDKRKNKRLGEQTNE
jgi:hypothetical protein